MGAGIGSLAKVLLAAGVFGEGGPEDGLGDKVARGNVTMDLRIISRERGGGRSRKHIPQLGKADAQGRDAGQLQNILGGEEKIDWIGAFS